MKILLISASYLPVKGGLQTATHALAKEWQKNGHTVRVLTNHYPRGLKSAEMVENISVERELFLSPSIELIKRGRWDIWLASLFYQPLVLLKLFILMKQFQPDVINLHFPSSQVPFVLWLKKHFAFKLIVSLHGTDIEQWLKEDKLSLITEKQNNPSFLQLRRVLKEAMIITACSADLLNKACFIEPEIKNKSHVVHNGVDWKLFQSKEQHLHPAPYLFAFGRLTAAKGFDLLIKAFDGLTSLQPNLDLLLAGDGSEAAALKEQVKKLGLSQRVFFLGALNPPEIVKLLNGCLFAVIPSRKEPFGIAALEAMAAGKAVLATKVGGLNEFVPKRNRLVNPNAESLLEGMQQMLQLNLTEIGEVNRRVAKKLSWAAAAEKFIALFNEAGV